MKSVSNIFDECLFFVVKIINAFYSSLSRELCVLFQVRTVRIFVAIVGWRKEHDVQYIVYVLIKNFYIQLSGFHGIENGLLLWLNTGHKQIVSGFHHRNGIPSSKPIRHHKA